MTATQRGEIPAELRPGRPPPGVGLRVGRLPSLEERILGLQRSIGNAGVSALLAGMAPKVQRQIGWPDANTKNDTRHTVGAVDRYPVYGLSGGNQAPNTNPKNWKHRMDDHAVEKADKRAIVLIPQGLKPTSKPDVLFELHGNYIGWREGLDDNAWAGSVKGDTRDQSAEAIAQSLPPTMIAVLPQGTATSNFGTIDPTTYIPEALGMIKGWEKAQTGRLLYSAHSGGGGTLDPSLVPKTRTAGLPQGLREIALFDAINGPNELASVEGWLRKSVRSDIRALKGLSEAEQNAYVETVVVFRGYFEDDLDDYVPLYKKLREFRNKLLSRNNRPRGVSAKTWANLGDHYQVIGPLHISHGEMVKHNLPDALAAMNLKAKP